MSENNIKSNIILRNFLLWELQLELAYYLDFSSVLVFYPNEDANFWQKKAELVLDVSKECFFRSDLMFSIRGDLHGPAGRYLYFLTKRALEFKKSFTLSSKYFLFCLPYSDKLVRIAAEQNNLKMLKNISEVTSSFIYDYYYYYGNMKLIDEQQLFVNNIGLTQNSYNGALIGSLEYNKIECYNYLKTTYNTYYQEALKINQPELFQAIFRGLDFQYYKEIIKDILQVNLNDTLKNYCSCLIRYGSLEKIKASKDILIQWIPHYNIEIDRLDFEIVKYFVEDLRGQCNFRGMLSSPFDIPDNLLSYLLENVKIEIKTPVLLRLIRYKRINLFLNIFRRGNLQLDENSVVRIIVELIYFYENLDIIKDIFEGHFNIIENFIKTKRLLARKILNKANSGETRFIMLPDIFDYLSILAYSEPKRKLPQRDTKSKRPKF